MYLVAMFTRHLEPVLVWTNVMVYHGTGVVARGLDSPFFLL